MEIFFIISFYACVFQNFQQGCLLIKSPLWKKYYTPSFIYYTYGMEKKLEGLYKHEVFYSLVGTNQVNWETQLKKLNWSLKSITVYLTVCSPHLIRQSSPLVTFLSLSLLMNSHFQRERTRRPLFTKRELSGRRMRTQDDTNQKSAQSHGDKLTWKISADGTPSPDLTRVCREEPRPTPSEHTQHTVKTHGHRISLTVGDRHTFLTPFHYL